MFILEFQYYQPSFLLSKKINTINSFLRKHAYDTFHKHHLSIAHKKLSSIEESFLPGCGESLLHSLFLCLNLFLCVNTDKKEEKERVFMMGALKNHRDERVSVSVEELVPQD
ncbi:hypothetical protein, partial [Bacillus thuringiensis]